MALALAMAMARARAKRRKQIMKEYRAEELQKIIREHHKWLLDNDEGKRANLSYANLSSADLCSANLRSANLRSANLCSADLSYADLSSADLCSADLRYVTGNMREIKSLQVETYKITYTQDVMAIGCEQHSIKEWFEFDNKRILEMEGKKALEFWKKWKPILKQMGVFAQPEEKVLEGER